APLPSGFFRWQRFGEGRRPYSHLYGRQGDQVFVWVRVVDREIATDLGESRLACSDNKIDIEWQVGDCPFSVRFCGRGCDRLQKRAPLASVRPARAYAYNY